MYVCSVAVIVMMNLRYDIGAGMVRAYSVVIGKCYSALLGGYAVGVHYHPPPLACPSQDASCYESTYVAIHLLSFAKWACYRW